MEDVVTAPGIASPPKKCPACDTVLELTVESCWKCGAKVELEIHTARYKEKQSFKPYLDINTDLGKEVYERLIQAFSEMDPRERPWCGIGVKVDLLAVSPRDVTIAVIKDLSGVKKGVVHVSRNWREPWYVETVDREEHHIQSNPCDQAERAMSAIKDNLKSFLRANGQPLSPRIKYLIIFPDGYDLAGPKDFSILERHEVLTLNLRNLRDLPEAILQPTQDERLDSRKYRKWIETGVLKSKDDSILGTWLDPAFDKVETKPPKEQLWWFRRPRRQEVSTEEEELSWSESSQTRLIQTKFKWRKLKLTMTVITAVIIGMVGWQIYDVIRPITSVPYSRWPVSPPRPENTTEAPIVIQAPMPQNIPSLPEHEKRDVLPPPESTKPSEVREPKLAGKDRLIESASKPRARTQASEDSELKRQKIELQIQKAVLRRAITGVTVSFTGDTAYLEGQVETENQKSAAEQAARSVPGVKEVRNSIEVNRFLSPEG